MTALKDAPNIGKTLQEKLQRAGIKSLEELKQEGSESTLLRIRAFDQSACLNMLCALEGAIQGIRWHDLPQTTKDKLKHFLRIKNIPLSPLLTKRE